ncbi:MAG: ice-binding family protein [bacterium]|nr:ice-binding family protein [bacterium]
MSINKKLFKFFSFTLFIVVLSGGFTSLIPVADAVTTATTPSLGAAATFGILTGTYTNSTGDTIYGDVGYTIPPSSPPTISGGTKYIAPNATYTQAGTDQGTALTALSAGVNASCDVTFAVGAIDLGVSNVPQHDGTTYAPGVYCIDGAMSIGVGGITLSGAGTYIFRSTGAFNVVSSSVVTLTGGALASDVFWTPVATTINAGAIFNGTVIDNAGITVGAGVVWTGRALAYAAALGSVTTNTDTITVPTPVLAPVNIVVNNSIQANTVTLTFNKPLEVVQAAIAGNYLVKNNAGTIIYDIVEPAVLSNSNKTVTLTLVTVDPANTATFITNAAIATGIKVTPSATNIKDSALNPYTGGLVTAAGAANNLDATPATVNAILVRTNATTYKVTFNEKVDKATAETLTNYPLSGSCAASTGNATGAVLQANGVDVVLTTPDTSGCIDSNTVIVTPGATITDVAGVAITSSAATYAFVTFTLTYSANAGGTIVGTTPQTVTYGADGTAVTATPNANYHWVSWSDAVGTAARTDTTITADKTVSATFAVDTHTVTFNKNGGDTEANPTTRVADYNATVTLPTAPTKTGSAFDSWNTLANGSGTTFDASTAVTDNSTVYAKWTTDSYTLTIPASAGTGSGSYGGTAAGLVVYNTAVSITATPAASSNFTSWTATGAAAACDGSAVSPCAFNMTGAASVTATYTLKTFTLTYSANAGGTIVGTTPQTINYGANGTAVTATPNANYHWVSWSDAVGTAARTDTNITADKTVSATFAVDTHYSSRGSVIISPVPPLIDVVKVPSPLALPIGPGTVTYTYTLRNIGTVSVTNITMVGDICSPIVLASGDTNADSKLDVTETWVYICSIILSKTHTNSMTTTGWANGISATNIASTTVIVGVPVVSPLIHVTKASGPLALLAGGGEVIYKYIVTNPGTIPLSNVNIINDKCTGLPGRVVGHSGDLNKNNLLESNESWSFICRANIFETTKNTVTVSGSANGLTAKGFAIATVIVGVAKLPNAGLPPQSAFGQQVKTITTCLKKGDKNNKVTILQQFLISQDKGPDAKELAKVGATSYFSILTRRALAEFQTKTGINPPLGNFGPITRAYISAN